MNSNIKKTFYFFKRNGIRKTYAAVCERLDEKKNAPYKYQPVSEEILNQQRKELMGLSLPLISIVVPTYRTPEGFLRALIDSVLSQTYPNWELILADASGDSSVIDVVKLYQDLRIKHYSLAENGGISVNTNQGIKKASGDYIALLDHDDLLTPDALYEMTAVLREDASRVVMVYSDEDKCNEDESIYFDLHKKLDFNKDLLLTNNYICHFTMLRADVMKRLCLRKEYDGAQDFDLFLRVMEYGEKNELHICHVAKVLYHWRSHELSTAANPQSKLYAYDAGKRAILDYLTRNRIAAKVEETPHVGFYKVVYENGVWMNRKDVVGVVLKRCSHGKVVPTVYDKKGIPLWDGLKKYYSGYMHRASMQQDVSAALLTDVVLRADWAKIAVSCMEEAFAGAESYSESEKIPFKNQMKEMIEIFEKVKLEINKKKNDQPIILKDYFSKLVKKYESDDAWRNLVLSASMEFAKKVQEENMLLLYDPYMDLGGLD